jgi:TRAP-type mannitol/chloroaromatic compound transport system permease small subunit
MRRVLAFIDSVSEYSGKLVSWLIVFIMGFLLVEVALRFLFNAPTIWIHELCMHLFGFFSVLAGAYVHRHKEHVRIDIVYMQFPPRIRAVIDTITYFIFFGYIGALLYYGAVLAIRAVELQQTVSPSPWGSPIWPLKISVPVASLLLLLQGLADFIRTVSFAVTGKEMS